MPTDAPTFPQAESPAVVELAARVTKLERSAKIWRTSFAALAVVVSMGANAALQDVEYGTVRAKRFNVIGEGGQVVAEICSTKNKTTNKDEGFLLVISEDKKKATFVMAGANELQYQDESDK
jgi:hypothetical protein